MVFWAGWRPFRILLAAVAAGSAMAAATPSISADPTPASVPATSSQTMVLLDVTAGMTLGRNRSRMEVQRQALKAMPSAASAPVRFAAYGGKACGGFADMGDATAAAVSLNDIAPGGRRNLAAALENAAADLPAAASPQRIVAVVGGPNQCLSALCARAERLKAERPNLRIDLVGFDLTDEQAERLNCITANSGGRLLRAAGNELATALTLAAAPAVRSAPRIGASAPPTPPKPLTRAAQTYGMTGPEPIFPRGVRLFASLTPNGPTLEVGGRFELLRADGNDVLRLVARTSRIATPLFAPPPGRYMARVVLGQAAATIFVEAPEVGIANYRLVLDAGQLEIAATISGRPMSGDTRYSIERLDAPGEILALRRSGRVLVTVPAGRYRVTARLDAAETSTETQVVAGHMARVDLETALGFLRLEGVAAGDEVQILRFGREVMRSNASRRLFRLPPGAYRVETAGVQRRVTVAARQVAEIAFAEEPSEQSPLAHTASERRLVAERSVGTPASGAP